MTVAAALQLPRDLVPPAYGDASLSAVLPAALAALGLDVTTATGIVGDDVRRAWGLPLVERVVLVLVDGLGHGNLTERAGHAPFLRSLLPQTRALTTVFPSTTAAAIGAFGTGTSPSRAGLVGYTQRNPETGALATMVSWEGAQEPAVVARETPLFETAAAAGVRVISTGPARFAGSGMTAAVLRGGGYVPAESLAARVDAAVGVAREPGLVYLYWGDIDKAGHHFGSESWQWGDELEAFDRELARLVRSVPTGTLVLVTADHGMVDVDGAARWDLATTPALSDGVAFVGGEPRAVHVYVRPRKAAEVEDRWRDVLGDQAVVIGRQAATESGLLGPSMAAHVREAVGDIVVVMRGRGTVVDSRVQTPALIGLVGVHGSLTAREMRVPLVAVVA